MALQTSADSPAPLRQVSQLVEGWVGRMGTIWVECQVTEVNRRPGVCFLTVRDLLASVSISVTCSSGVLDASPAPVTAGSRVVLHAKPTFYLPTGRLSLEAREIRPVGEGELLAQLERRKQLLAAEGLFDPRLKQRLPL
ncbi:MAG: exodeoxyribonuclease VII large subunit, partial [Longimicrobiales bacterium]